MLADSLDRDQLEFAVGLVASTADKIDDDLAVRFGGTTHAGT